MIAGKPALTASGKPAKRSAEEAAVWRRDHVPASREYKAAHGST